MFLCSIINITILIVRYFTVLIARYNIDHHKLMIFLANRLGGVSLRLYLPQERAAASYECLRRGIYAATIKRNNDVILSNFIILRAGGLPRVTLSRRWSVALQCTRFTSRSGSAARHEILSPLRSIRGVALVQSWYAVLSVSLTSIPQYSSRECFLLYRPRELTTHILEPYLTRKARELPHARHAWKD